MAGAMVAGLAFVATAVATLFAEATFKRWRQGRRPHEAAWTVALALFALASAALATGASTGWDRGVFRVFYLLGAVLNVPWLALGTLVLSGGGPLQGILGHDEAFTVSLATGIAVVYAGFLVAARPARAPVPAPEGASSLGASASPVGSQA